MMLPPIDYSGRGGAVRAALTGRSAAGEPSADAMLATDPTSVRWLTGFTGSSATVVVVPDQLVVITDGRYAERAAAELAEAGVEAEIVIGVTAAEQHRLLLDRLDGLGPIGVDPATMSHARWQALAGDLSLVALADLLVDLRRVKDAGELARIELACRITDDALATIAPQLGDGVTESDIRNELDYHVRRHGAAGPSYDTIVASGPEHAARPHHEVGDRRIIEGDTVVIDVGALVDGYHSDMTRSFVVGEPDPTQREWYDVLLASQLAGLGAVRAGVAAAEVDAAARGVLVEAGLGEWYVHSTGHGVGLEIHETPILSSTATASLRAGEVVTVEPGLYRVGFGGFRIEDLVEVTESGCRVLTSSPKDSPCLPSRPTI